MTNIPLADLSLPCVGNWSWILNLWMVHSKSSNTDDVENSHKGLTKYLTQGSEADADADAILFV